MTSNAVEGLYDQDGRMSTARKRWDVDGIDTFLDGHSQPRGAATVAVEDCRLPPEVECQHALGLDTFTVSSSFRKGERH